MNKYYRLCVYGKYVYSLICVLSVLSCGSTLEAGQLADSQKVYEEHVANLEEGHQKQIAALSVEYLKALENTRIRLQNEGKLESLLAVREETARFEKEKLVPKEVSSDVDVSVSAMWDLYRREYQKISAQHEQDLTSLRSRYLEHLSQMKASLTRAGNVEEALAFLEEYNRVAASKQLPESNTSSLQLISEPVLDEPPPFDRRAERRIRPLLQFRGRGRRARDEVMNMSGRFPVVMKVEHEGRNNIADGMIDLQGGRSMIPDVDDLLLDACKKSNAITIEAEVTVPNTAQRGPARIISFSLGSLKRNFSLCQEGDAFVVRLRTTDTGLNGTNPEIRAGKIERDKRHRIHIAYRPGELRFYLDGERLSTPPISGDFSNWEACRFILGNEWDDDRPWRGQIHNLEIYAGFLEN
jgi:hypothetical protein